VRFSLFPCPKAYDPPFPHEKTLFKLESAIVWIAPQAMDTILSPGTNQISE